MKLYGDERLLKGLWGIQVGMASIEAVAKKPSEFR